MQSSRFSFLFFLLQRQLWCVWGKVVCVVRVIVNVMVKRGGGESPAQNEVWQAIEFLKKGGETAVHWLVRLFSICMAQGEGPEDW